MGAVVLLGASLAACFDSRRIVFNRPDAEDAGVAPPASPSQATGVEPAGVVPDGERAAAPGILESTALDADESVPFDAGVAAGPIDAGASDAAP